MCLSHDIGQFAIVMLVVKLHHTINNLNMFTRLLGKYNIIISHYVSNSTVPYWKEIIVVEEWQQAFQ